MLRLLDMEQWFSLSIAARAVYIGSCIERNSEARIFAIWGWQVPVPSKSLRVLAIRVLLEVLKGVSTVQHWTPFFVNIKEVLMIVPVVYATVGSCGVALLRRSGGLLQVCWERCEV